MWQQDRASQGFRVPEWADIKGSLGVHLLRLGRRTVDSKGRTMFAVRESQVGVQLSPSALGCTGLQSVCLCMNISSTPNLEACIPTTGWSLKSPGCFSYGWVI